MASLSGQTIANTFDSILHVEDDTAGLVATSTDSRVIQDGVGANSALALATDSVRITSTNKLYINDVGGEYISGDGTDLTIAAGNDINLTATTDINVPVNVGLRFGDGGENIETDNTDFTITSGGKLNLAPTSDVHTANGTGVVLGHTAQVAMGEVTSEAQILGTTETDACLAIGLSSTTDALSPSLKFVKGAHATIGNHSVTVADNEELGKVQAYGSDATDSDTLSSEIAFNIDDDGVGAGTLGGEILLKTSGKDGTLDTAVTIDSSQKVTLAENFNLQATKYLYLDGGGDTAIQESEANKMSFFTEGRHAIEVATKSGTLSHSTPVTLDAAGAAEDGNWLISFTLSNASDSSAGGVANFSSAEDGEYHTVSLSGSNGLTWAWSGDNMTVQHNQGDNVAYQSTIMKLL